MKPSEMTNEELADNIKSTAEILPEYGGFQCADELCEAAARLRLLSARFHRSRSEATKGIVQKEKSEKVDYVCQWFDSLHEHWRECIVFHELEQARDAILWRRKVLADKKWRIFKRTITEEVVE